jgi:hypothetical protein
MSRLGIIGTLVWDTIHSPDDNEVPVRDWGGIAYSLAAFEAVAPEGWEMVPIIKVGSDLRREADDFLGTLGRFASDAFVTTVPEANNRVDLYYQDRSRRCERLTGGVPGWTWSELEVPALSCDALYVNFIGGWEINLEAAAALGRGYEPPTYCDVHSLILGVGPDGVRRPRPLETRATWLGGFDLVQVNEDELAILSEAGPDRIAMAEDLLADGPDAVFVTLGAEGAAWVAASDVRWMGGAHGPRRGTVHLDPGETISAADPTGCGDVWGVCCFMSLLGGAALDRSVARANAMAARCAGIRGTAGLAERLVEAPAFDGTESERIG